MHGSVADVAAPEYFLQSNVKIVYFRFALNITAPYIQQGLHVPLR
jgi:hypothetical protein